MKTDLLSSCGLSSPCESLKIPTFLVTICLPQPYIPLEDDMDHWKRFATLTDRLQTSPRYRKGVFLWIFLLTAQTVFFFLALAGALSGRAPSPGILKAGAVLTLISLLCLPFVTWPVSRAHTLLKYARRRGLIRTIPSWKGWTMPVPVLSTIRLNLKKR